MTQSRMLFLYCFFRWQNFLLKWKLLSFSENGKTSLFQWILSSLPPSVLSLSQNIEKIENKKNNDINTSVVIIIIIVDIGTNTPLPPPTLRNQFLSNANIEKVKKEWKKYFWFCFSRPLQRLRPFSPVTMMQPLKTGKKLVRLFEIFSFTV